MAILLPEAAVEVPEAEAAATGLIAWLGRNGVLSGAVSLLSLLFGRRSPEPATGNAMRPVVDLLAYPMRALNIAMVYINTALDVTTHKLAQVRNELGSAYNSALRYARQWDADLRRALNYRIDYVNKRVGDAYNAALTHARQWDAQLRAALHSEIVYVNDRVGQAYNAALVHARQWDADLRRALHSEIVYVNDRVGQAYNAALKLARQWDAETRTATQADITHQVTQGIRATWPVMLGELAGATAAAGPDLPGLRSLISAVPRNAPANLEAAASDPMAIDRVLLRAMTDCVIPNCRNLSKAGRDLHGLGQLLGAAGFLAFIAYATAHPDEAARSTYDVAGPITDGVANAVKAIVHVG